MSRKDMCGHKHRHPSSGKAEAQKRSMVERFGDDPELLSVYWCRYCRHWHVGHVRQV